MIDRWRAVLCILAVLAGSGAAGAAEAVLPPPVPAAEAGTDGTGRGHGSSPAAGRENAQKEAKEAAPVIRDIDGSPLFGRDFAIRRLSLGASPADMEKVMGMPQTIQKGAVRDVYGWQDLAVQCIHDQPYSYTRRADLSLSYALPGRGAEIFSITGPGILTARGISVGSSRENVVRVYGAPEALLWDGPQKSVYLSYGAGQEMIVFTIREGKVSRIRIAYRDEAFLPKETAPVAVKGNGMEERDFQIAGYALGETFTEHAWLSWEKKAVNPEQEIWYYAGFGVRMDSGRPVIRALFLTGGDMMTSRGITIGDQQSTVEAVYGAPHKVEMNHIDGHAQSAYIYFSQDRKKVLIIYIDDKTRRVVNVMVMDNPQIVSPFQSALDTAARFRKAHAPARGQ